jgi:predicted oxidoreductase
MKTYRIPHTDLDVSRIAYGCMKLGGSWDSSEPTAAQKKLAAKNIAAALDAGINFFDHANIYTKGKSESVFGEILRSQPGLREKIVIQTKCGIRIEGDPEPGIPARYDYSYEHIVRSVEGSLKRLQTDHVEILLLHRPDALVQPEEVARAFSELHKSGKVRHFGVSNHNGWQIDLLRKYVQQPFVVNQLELNLLHYDMLNEGVKVNQDGLAYSAAAGIVDYCRLHDILVQAWSPVAVGDLIDPSEKASKRVRRAAKAVARMAKAKNTSREAIALAWLMRHPAGIQPVVGTTKTARITASALADDIELSREEWYTLFEASRGESVP